MFRCTLLGPIGLLGLVSIGCSSSPPGIPITETPIDSGPSGPLVDATMPEAAADEAAANPIDGGMADVVDASMDADAADAGDCPLGPSGEALDLKCTGLYSDWKMKTVSSDVHEFDPGLHLWSDGAVKTRWIYLPPNATDSGRAPIDTSNMDEWTFPVGTKVWKEFVLGGKRIETRLLWKQASGDWYMTTYQWSPDETMATEFTDGELDADGNGYEIPAQYECNHCHAGRLDKVLGFEAISLSSPRATPITMGSLVDAGWVTNAPDASLVIPGNPTAAAALGYLHANCGNACHNPYGAAMATGFYMRLVTGQLGSVQATDTWTTGVNYPSRFKPPGAVQGLVRLAPYDAGASCVHYRMSTRDGVDDAGSGEQMPPLDTHKVDEGGIDAITQWIDQGCQ